MTLKECYMALGGDYDEVLARLRSEKMVSTSWKSQSHKTDK